MGHLERGWEFGMDSRYRQVVREYDQVEHVYLEFDPRCSDLLGTLKAADVTISSHGRSFVGGQKVE